VIFDPTQLGPQGRVFDGSNVSVKINGVDAPENCLKGIGYTEAVEGKEAVVALGKRVPFAQTSGTIIAGETTLMVFTSHLDALLSAWSPGGYFKDEPVDILITLDEKSSPGLAALAAALKLGTKTISLLGCDYVGIGSTFEVAGPVSVTELKVKPLRIEVMGFAGTAG